MPTYEYRCPDGHTFDLFQKMSDEAGADCPECGKAAERLMSGGAGFLFKGDGFYITDYRSEGYKAAAQKDKASQEAGSKEKKGGDSKGSGGDASGGKSGSDAGASKPAKSGSSGASAGSPTKKAD